MAEFSDSQRVAESMGDVPWNFVEELPDDPHQIMATTIANIDPLCDLSTASPDTVDAFNKMKVYLSPFVLHSERLPSGAEGP